MYVFQAAPAVHGIHDLAWAVAALALAAGCTVSRVSVLPPREPGPAVKPQEVKVYRSFRDIQQPWSVEGVIAAYTLPIAANTAAKREALIRETVAPLGVNALVGLQTRVGEGIGRTGHSNAVLARVGDPRPAGAGPPPFLVCLPPVELVVPRDPSMDRLDGYLREQLQYFFSYTRGYHVLLCDQPGLTRAAILEGRADPASLGEALGIPADFALLCDLQGYDEEGSVLWTRSRTLRIAMSLHDLRTHEVVWSAATRGIATRNLTTSLLFLGSTGVFLAAGSEPDDLATVRAAVMEAMETVPAVPGFRGGAVSPIDRR